MENNGTQKNDNNIVVFSAKKENPAKEIEKENIEKENKENIDDALENNTIEKQKETDVEKKIEENEKAETIDDKEKEKQVEEEQVEKPSFKVIPSEEKKETQQQEKKETESQLNEASVISFLEKQGIKVSSLTEISKKEVLPEAVAEFKKFNEETGRGIHAYYNSKRDWTKEDSDTTIKEYLRYQNVNLTEEDIDTELQLLKLSDEEKEDLSPREIREVEQKYRKKYAEALGFMKNKAKEYSLPTEEKVDKPKQLTPEEIADAYRPYWEQRDKSLEKLNEVSLNLEGLGTLKMPISQEHKDLIAEATQTQADYFKRWQNEEGKIDTDKSSLDVAWSIEEIRNQFISDLVTQAHTKMAEQFSKEKRNVTIDKKNTVATQNTTGKGVITFNKKEGNSKNMGTPLIPVNR